MEKNVSALRQRIATLKTKRAAAKTALDAAVSARQAFVTTGDLDDGAATDRALAKLQGVVDSASSLLAGLDAAIAAVSAQLSEAESALTAERESAARAAAADKIARNLAALEPEIEKYLAAGRKLAADLGKFGTAVFDASALSDYVGRATGEIELAAAVVAREIGAAIDRIRDGTARIPRMSNSPSRLSRCCRRCKPKLFLCSRHARYCDPATGALVRLHRYQDAVISPRLAEIALRSGAATQLSDPVRKLNAGRWPPMNSASAAFDLDASTSADAEPRRASKRSRPKTSILPPPPDYEPPPPKQAIKPSSRSIAASPI